MCPSLRESIYRLTWRSVTRLPDIQCSPAIAGEHCSRRPQRTPTGHCSCRQAATVIVAAHARQNRYGARDAAAIWIAFNHGLRVSELADLRWGDVRREERKIMVRRLKGSASGEHPLTEQDKRFLGP